MYETGYELTFLCSIVTTTDKAILLEIDGEEYWCPRAAIDGGDAIEFDKTKADFTATADDFYIKRWWLDQNGLL